MGLEENLVRTRFREMEPATLEALDAHRFHGLISALELRVSGLETVQLEDVREDASRRDAAPDLIPATPCWGLGRAPSL